MNVRVFLVRVGLVGLSVGGVGCDDRGGGAAAPVVRPKPVDAPITLKLAPEAAAYDAAHARTVGVLDTLLPKYEWAVDAQQSAALAEAEAKAACMGRLKGDVEYVAAVKAADEAEAVVKRARTAGADVGAASVAWMNAKSRVGTLANAALTADVLYRTAHAKAVAAQGAAYTLKGQLDKAKRESVGVEAAEAKRQQFIDAKFELVGRMFKAGESSYAIQAAVRDLTAKWGY